MPPMEAALKGAEQIGFTILSLTVSLIAVLIPLLFMGDVVGRLFREFAVTLAVTIIISAAVSLTLTPMMCSRILKHKPEDQQGRFYRVSERMFERMIAFYGRTLNVVLEYQTITLFVAVATLVLTVVLVHPDPEGLLPCSGHGRDSGNFAGTAVDFVRRDDAEATATGRRDLAGPVGGEPFVVHRRGRNEHDAEQRAHFDQPEGYR